MKGQSAADKSFTEHNGVAQRGYFVSSIGAADKWPQCSASKGTAGYWLFMVLSECDNQICTVNTDCTANMQMQRSQVTKYMYSRIVLKYNFEVDIFFHFILFFQIICIHLFSTGFYWRIKPGSSRICVLHIRSLTK